MLDCQWLRILHSYGLLPASFRPAKDIGVLRAYMRHRQMLIEYAAAHVQHMQKALTHMNLQLQHVLSDITGWTGMNLVIYEPTEEINVSAVCYRQVNYRMCFLKKTLGFPRRSHLGEFATDVRQRILPRE